MFCAIRVANVFGVLRIRARMGKARDLGVRRIFRVAALFREWGVKETHPDIGIAVFDQGPGHVLPAGAGVEQRELRLRAKLEMDAASNLGQLMGPVATKTSSQFTETVVSLVRRTKALPSTRPLGEQAPFDVADHVIGLGDGSRGHGSRTSARP